MTWRKKPGLRVIPLSLSEANELVARWHRHHKPTVGHRFSLGVMQGNRLVAAAIVGHPVARVLNQHEVAEVLRLVSDGTKNACSILLGACRRTAKEMGFQRIQTYTLPIEGGASLKASGWTCEGQTGGGQWKHTGFEARGGFNRRDQPIAVKTRWACKLNEPLAGPREVALAAFFPAEVSA